MLGNLLPAGENHSCDCIQNWCFVASCRIDLFDGIRKLALRISYSAVMQGENGERWRKLCEQAAVEQDPRKLMELVSQITQMLDEKEQRLLRQQQTEDQETSNRR